MFMWLLGQTESTYKAAGALSLQSRPGLLYLGGVPDPSHLPRK